VGGDIGQTWTALPHDAIHLLNAQPAFVADVPGSMPLRDRPLIFSRQLSRSDELSIQEEDDLAFFFFFTE